MKQQIAMWWNGCWGTLSNRRVWLELEPDGRYLIRWRGPDWRDRDGAFWTRDPAVAISALKDLLGEDKSGWQETLLDE